MRSKWIVLMLGIVVAGAAGAESFTDDFNREDIRRTSEGSAFGTEYFIAPTGNASFQLKDGQLTTGSSGQYEDSLLVYTNFTILSSEGRSFEVAVDITYDHLNPTLSGLVFNYQNTSNYYAMRITTGMNAGTGYVQLVKVTAGKEKAIATNYITDLSNNETYRLTVSSDRIGKFTCYLVGESVDKKATFKDLDDEFSGGYGGIYVDRAKQTGGIHFDRFFIASTAPSL